MPASMNEYQGENREERLSRGIEVKLKYVPIVAYFSLYTRLRPPAALLAGAINQSFDGIGMCKWRSVLAVIFLARNL